MTKLSQLTNRITRISVIVSDVIIQRLLFPMSLAIAVGTGAWSLNHINRLNDLLKNTVPKARRIECILYILAAAVVVGITY
jgi:hypothetical protein